VTLEITGAPAHHDSCAAIMGSQAMSVDSELWCIPQGLRIINASVIAALRSMNTNAPTIMIAEKGATMIKGAARQILAA
jgi:choline dehydrogenase